MIKLSRKSRSAPDDQFIQPFPYRVHFDTYGGTVHGPTLFSNKIAYLVSFLDWKYGYSCGNSWLSLDFVPEQMQEINVADQYWTIITGAIT